MVVVVNFGRVAGVIALGETFGASTEYFRRQFDGFKLN